MSSVHEKIMDAVVDARALLSLPYLVEKRPALCRVPPVPTPCAEAHALARGDLSLDGVTHLGGLSVHNLLTGLEENRVSDSQAGLQPKSSGAERPDRRERPERSAPTARRRYPWGVS